MEFEDLLNFSKEFRDVKDNEEKKLPYHINIIDELHINENGHSRVLTKLLQYQNEQKEYVILQSLLDHISNILPALKIKIEEPAITQEKKRIDLWVRDNGYALIFENKVYNADDQDAQICRYIEETKKEHYRDDQIYVIYLSKDGKEPDPQSWGEYKDSFKSRYVNLSFRSDILPWLKEDILPKFNNNAKEKYLQSAIQQYVDFLEGDKMFRTGEIYNEMNTNLGKLIEIHYSLQNESVEKKIANLLKEINNVSDVKKQMEMLTTKYYNQLYETWYADIKQNYNLETQLLPNDKWTIIRVKTKTYNVSIAGGTYDNQYKCFYVGIAPVPEDQRDVLTKNLGLGDINEGSQSIHKCFPLDDYEDGYKKVFSFFKELVTKCEEL